MLGLDPEQELGLDPEQVPGPKPEPHPSRQRTHHLLPRLLLAQAKSSDGLAGIESIAYLLLY